MPKILTFLIIVCVLVALLYVYSEYDAKKREEKQKELEESFILSSSEGKPTEPVSGEARQERQRSDASSGASAPSNKALVYKAAKDAGVTISQYTETHGGAAVDCWSWERNNLGDFLDLLHRRGIIRDIDLDKTQHFKPQVTKDLRQRWRQILYVMF